MKILFKIVYDFLKFLEKFTGLSYEEINIIIWFILIPLSWAILLDTIFKKHYFKICFLTIIIVSLLYIDNFKIFSNTLFDQSVNFLNLFNHFGSNYVASSVIICVLIPLLIYIVLIRKAYFKNK